MRAFGAFLSLVVFSVLCAEAAASVEQGWTKPARLGPVQGEIAMTSNARGKVLLAWQGRGEIRWRFADSGRSGRIRTPAPGTPAAALNDRGGAALAWSVAGEFGGPSGSVSLATRAPGETVFRTVRTDIGNDEATGPPALALAPSGRVA